MEWQAYCSIEPFGPPAGFWQSGLVASALVNVNRTKENQKVCGPNDFMPESMKPEPIERDDADEAEVMKARFHAYCEQVKRQEHHG